MADLTDDHPISVAGGRMKPPEWPDWWPAPTVSWSTDKAAAYPDSRCPGCEGAHTGQEIVAPFGMGTATAPPGWEKVFVAWGVECIKAGPGWEIPPWRWAE